MKVRIRTNLGSAEFPGKPWKFGEEHDVSDDVGKSLVARGVAECIDTAVQPAKTEPPKAPHQPKKLRGVQDKPTIANPTPPAVAGDELKPEE